MIERDVGVLRRLHAPHVQAKDGKFGGFGTSASLQPAKERVYDARRSPVTLFQQVTYEQ